MQKRWSLFFILLGLTFSNLASANTLAISPEQFTSEYQTMMANKAHFDSSLDPQSWQYIRNRMMRYKLHLSKKQRTQVNAYLKWEKQKNRLTPVANFRDELVQVYTLSTNTVTTPQLITESTQIALALIGKTQDLRKEFNMSFIPIWQNFLINAKIRKRGFCYHWATDLLETIIPLQRTHFSVTWSESNQGTLSEHNVTTIFPKGKDFKDGLLFDPWRTGGDPFWRAPLKDKHFNWKKRPEYGIY